ncbi:DNA repair metallo-beta-lactamase-domain-containing protein [Radiomyces spectabilis]|uniref:DNA repair metallo-beta-lactamase-domain-containing protein n=1 Tax=Radiomyces spectabilis TaxID=64574 RepID=UPI0022207B8C|nr:DNA repair metallo-beta-lactamase-domain-containing protein [Radiomyces spectabilis]KAI8391368.1 DNA repair metallo-beta-lactamase-domain-containing protein [Radiomyces spectabilis]
MSDLANADRKRRRSKAESTTGSASRSSKPRHSTLKDYFSNHGSAASPLSSDRETSSTAHAYDADLAKAIALSLQAAEASAAEKVTPSSDSESTEHTEKSNSSKVCPVCAKVLSVSDNEFEVHVNECLDDDRSSSNNERADSESSDREKKDQALSFNGEEPTESESSDREKKGQASSWTQLFQDIPRKISGIWTSNEDVAPGLREPASSTDWFGETKKQRAARKAAAQTHHLQEYKKRGCPMYKRLPGTSFVVDAFSYGEVPGCQGYFLSHFHGDHYTYLSKAWRHGPIYASQITINLCHRKLGVDPALLHPLPMDQECKLEGSDVTVTLIDANHCPGSVLFLFKVPQPHGKTLRYLHTGDFRANPRMCLHPSIKQPENPIIDILYLDTTYLNPKYAFPAQEESVAAACKLVRQYAGMEEMDDGQNRIEKWFQKKLTAVTADEESTLVTETTTTLTTTSSEAAETPEKRLLVVVGTYSIGKEKMFYNIAKTLNSKVFVTDKKKYIIDCLDNPELSSMLTDDPRSAQVHVIPLQHIQPENLSAYFHSLQPCFTEMIAFRPTGWTFSSSASRSRTMTIASLAEITAPPSAVSVSLKPSYSSLHIKIFGVPYSEHSSFRELAAFIASLDIHRIVPTVNVGSEQSREKMGAFFKKWQEEKKKNGKIEIVPYPSIDHW